MDNFGQFCFWANQNLDTPCGSKSALVSLVRVWWSSSSSSSRRRIQLIYRCYLSLYFSWFFSRFFSVGFKLIFKFIFQLIFQLIFTLCFSRYLNWYLEGSSLSHHAPKKWNVKIDIRCIGLGKKPKWNSAQLRLSQF